VWLSYRTADNKIFLGKRPKEHTAHPGYTPEYKVVNLASNPAAMATSSRSPALCPFKEKLYLAWKPEDANVIKYQRTDGETHLEFGLPYMLRADHMVSGPVIGSTTRQIFFSWLAGPERQDGTYDIWIAESTDGNSFDAFNYSRQNIHAHSRYPPCFSARGDVMAIHWIHGTKVFRAEINPDDTEYDAANLPEPHVIDFATIGQPKQDVSSATNLPHPYLFPIGIACAYGENRRWLVVTRSDDTVWIVPPKGGEFYTLTAADTSSAERVGAAFVEISHKSRNVFIVWKDYRDNNYRECKIHCVSP